MNETNKNKRKEISDQAISYYQEKTMIGEEYQYLFDEEIEELYARPLQYLEKWLETAALVDKRRGQSMRLGHGQKRDG